MDTSMITRVLAGALAPSVGTSFSGPLEAQQLRETFRAVNPSVVVVRTVERSETLAPSGGSVASPGLGSGVLVSGDGKVLTAAHVVLTADRVAVEFADGTLVSARVVASEPRADVALLQLQRVPTGAVAARLDDSDSLQVGDDVFIQSTGLLDQQVADGSPVAALDLRAGSVQATVAGESLLVGGDIVLAVAGISVAADDAVIDRIRDALSRLQPGETFGVAVLREGKIVALSTRASAPRARHGTPSDVAPHRASRANGDGAVALGRRARDEDEFVALASRVE